MKLDMDLVVELLQNEIYRLRKREVLERVAPLRSGASTSPTENLFGVTKEEADLVSQTMNFTAPKNLNSESSLNTIIRGNQQ